MEQGLHVTKSSSAPQADAVQARACMLLGTPVRWEGGEGGVDGVLLRQARGLMKRSTLEPMLGAAQGSVPPVGAHGRLAAGARRAGGRMKHGTLGAEW